MVGVVYPVVRLCALLLPLQWPAIGSDSEDRLRFAQLIGSARSETFLLRSFSSSLDTTGAVRPSGRPAVTLLQPNVALLNNTSLPFSLNQGALWAGRGWSTDVRAGVVGRWGHVTLVLAPELVATENRPYAMPVSAVELPRPPDRSPYSTPWHVGLYSIDLPLRFGATSFARIDPGQSTLAFEHGGGAVSVGLSTANEWWGPGIRNAIVLSNNAPGIWRAFVRVQKKNFALRWFLGGLFESPYFDTTRADDRRSITALAMTWTPTENLTIGAARAVYAPLEAWTDVFGHAFDVLRGAGMHRLPGDTVDRPSRDQVFSIFGRWVFPLDGFAVHAEWARNQLPGSLRELLVSPNHAQGYTLGLEWAHARFRLQAEDTYLEKSPAYRNLPEQTWYTGGSASQGYTQRGQVIGAAIGPGASSQYFAADYFAPRWHTGLFLGRIRWDNDALYLTPDSFPKRCGHDVTIFAGGRGSGRSRWGEIAATLTLGRRLNVFYDHLTTCEKSPKPDPTQILDLGNTTLEIRFSPRL
jgi:hypothetical protein